MPDTVEAKMRDLCIKEKVTFVSLTYKGPYKASLNFECNGEYATVTTLVKPRKQSQAELANEHVEQLKFMLGSVSWALHNSEEE